MKNNGVFEGGVHSVLSCGSFAFLSQYRHRRDLIGSWISLVFLMPQ